MDSEQLFWATGIDNSKLNADEKAAEAIFQRLSTNVKSELSKIERAYDGLRLKANMRFTNPVDPNMIASIKSQIRELGKVIDEESSHLGNLSYSYDKAMSKIRTSALRIGQNMPKTSPLQGTVDNIKESVVQADRQLSFLERRFKYAASTLIAYGSFRFGKEFINDMITVKGQFDQLRVAIDAFTGSADTGARVFGHLTRLAVKSPFELKDITDSAKQLLAYGTAADDAARSVKMLSDIAAGSGQPIRDVAYLYGTSLTQGRLYARDLFQFANRGIPIYSELAKVMGVNTEELMKLTKNGKVGFEQLQKAVENMTAAGGKYFGLSDKLAETTYGKISNLRDKWSIALNEIGTETDGIVSAGVEGTTYLIQNWEKVAKAIEGVALAYGSYKAATTVGLLIQNTADYASMYKEAEALNILTTAEQRAALAKQGYILGSAEYTAALRLETAAQLKKAQEAVVSTNAEVAANEELLLSKKQMQVSFGEEVIARELALSQAKKSGIASQVEAAQTELNIAAKEHEAATLEVNTISKQLNASKTAQQTAADRLNFVSTVQSTAAQAANTASTNILTLAKIKLTAAMARLNAIIAANPWTAAAIAIGALVYVIWQLHDGTTAAERAQNKFKESIGKITDATDREREAFEKLLNTIKNKNASDAERQRAYDKLKETYPDIIRNMTLEQVALSDSVKLQKANNEQLTYNENIQKRILAIEAKRRMDREKQLLDEDRRKTPMSRQRYEEAKMEYDLAQKEADISSKAINDAIIARARQKTLPEVHNEEYWKGIRDQAHNARVAMDDSLKGTKEWNRLLEKERKATEKLALFDKVSKLDSVEEKATRDKQEAEKLKQQVTANETKLADASKQAEIDRQQQVVDAMKEGYQKKQAQIELNYNKEMAKVREKEAELLKLEQETAYKKWLIQNPNWKKEGKVFKAPTALSMTSTEIVGGMSNTATQKQINDTADMYRKLLIELQDYDTQRKFIEETYNDKIKFLTSERTDSNKKEIDAAIEQAKRLSKEEMAKVDLSQLQKDINWGDVFSNLDAMSSSALKNVQEKLKAFLEKSTGSISKTDAKTVSDAINSISSQLYKNNPIARIVSLFKAQKDAENELKIATQNLKEAQEEYNKVTSNTASTNEEVVNATNNLTKAREKLNNATSKESSANKEIKKSSKDILQTFSEIGDALGTISSTLKDIGASDSLQTYVSSMSDIVEGGAKFAESMQSGNIAGMVSGAIQQTSGYLNLVNEIFGGNSATRYYQNLKEELGSYIDVLNKVIDRQKEAMDGLVGYAAVQASQEAQAAIEDEIESYRKLAEAAGNAGGGTFSHSYRHRTDKRLKNYWDDISKSAGETVDSITDLYDMTPEQLAKIRDENAYAWSQITPEIQEYLDKIIEAGDSLDDLVKDTNDKLTGLSFDSAKDSLDSLLMDANTTMGDIADNFEDYMRTAILNIVKSKYLTEALSGWYNDFVADTNSGQELTKEEILALKNEYMDIFKNAQDMYDNLLDIADVSLTSSTNSTSGAISQMSQESADILTAQFSAIRINVSDILLYLRNQGTLLEIAFKDISEIAQNTRELIEMKSILKNLYDFGIKIK